MRVVCDTGPLIAAANSRDPNHILASGLVSVLGRDLVILDTVAAETDLMLRRRYGKWLGSSFLSALAGGKHGYDVLTPKLLSRAAELDSRYADLDLGLVDTSIMAYAERHRLPVCTFDYRDFRATESVHGPWNLLVGEDELRRARID